MTAYATKSTKDKRSPGSRSAAVALPVLAPTQEKIRKSTMSRWRALSLVVVHLLIIGHIVHWLIAGKTISPIEPAEAMFAINEGKINAGLIFFATALLGTLIFGRFLCGWGCHLVAYQDLCNWMLKKIGIKPKPFRSRLLIFAPLALALYMYVWPSAYRLVAGQPFPTATNHLITAEFWNTFPGLGIGLLTLAVCGFMIVYFLGAKGFCSYACPYGGFFGVVDQVSPARIRVKDSCEQSGHCTATCTSNVRVHEEVALYGMVVNPGCMKCMDCISVCPNDALYFGYTKPAIVAKAKVPRKPTSYDFTLTEELILVIVGVGSLLAYRGLYGQIPLLLAMGMAAITAFFTGKLIRMVGTANVRLQNLQLKRGRRWTPWGITFGVFAAGLLVFAGHSGLVQYHALRGRQLFASVAIGNAVWSGGNSWWDRADAMQRSTVDEAIGHFDRAEQIALASTPGVLQDLVWLHLAKGDDEAAERVLRRIVASWPDRPDGYRGLAGVLRKTQNYGEAEGNYRRALTIKPTFEPARAELGAMLRTLGRQGDAIALYREGAELVTSDGRWGIELGRLLMELDRFSEARDELLRVAAAAPDAPAVLVALGMALLQAGEAERGTDTLERALELDGTLTQARYNLALALLSQAHAERAAAHLREVIVQQPNFSDAHYNLGVSIFMTGGLVEAMPHVREAIRLAPEDSQAEAFLSMLLERTGRTESVDVPGIRPTP